MASAVARQAAKRPVGVLPPASPFAELLRRSRFASYDPEIKQTYGAPPAYAHRGNWGLKRPIAQKRRNAYITLKSYEDHAQYIEWNNAESQVRFIKRIEELNITPEVASDTPFARNLGAAQSSVWLTDSEFDTAADSEYIYTAKGKSHVVEPPEFGHRGPGAYANTLQGIKAPLVTQRDGPWNYRQPNIEAMSAEEFEAYVEKLRTLRPAFFERVRSELALRAKAGTLRGTALNPDMSDLQLAMINNVTKDHSSFINEFFEQEFAKRQPEPAAADPESGEALPKDFVKPKVKPQPHRNGGLMYAHPTRLETYFTTTPKPAHVLEETTYGRFASRSNPKTSVSFGGVVAELIRPPQLVEPLFTRTTGPEEGVAPGSVVNVRVESMVLQQAPSVVGKHGQGLNGVSIKEQVVVAKPHAEREKGNPHVPGSQEYVGYVRDKPMRMTGWNESAKRSRGPKMRRSVDYLRSLTPTPMAAPSEPSGETKS